MLEFLLELAAGKSFSGGWGFRALCTFLETRKLSLCLIQVLIIAKKVTAMY